MKKAPTPRNEEERLKALKKYKVLDTEQEKTFDEITRLASLICQTKIALISLIDEDRQWFKSKFGLDADQTGRDVSFCGHAIMSDEVFVVEDSSVDDRFCDNPLVTGAPHVNFYAGAPLITPQGHRIGTLCVIDHEKKTLDQKQIDSLQVLAGHVVGLLELKLKTEELERIENQSKDIQTIAKTGGWELDIKTFKTRWTDEVYEIHKLPIGTPTNKIDGISYYAEHEQSRLESFLDKCILKQTKFDEEFKFIDNEKNNKWVRVTGEPIFDDTGNVDKVIGIIQDITKNKEDHNKRDKALKELHSFFQVSLDFLSMSNSEGVLCKVNPTFTNILGHEEKDLIDKSFFSFIHPDDIPKSKLEWSKLTHKKTTIKFESRFLSSTCEYKDLQWTCSIDSNTGLIFMAARDVTEEKARNKLDVIKSEISKEFINYRSNPHSFFSFLLSKITNFSQSTYGLIGEVSLDNQGNRVIISLATTDSNWNDEFFKLKDFYDVTINNERTFIYDPDQNSDPNQELPPFTTFVSIPIFQSGRISGVIGLADRPQNYSMDYINYIRPLVNVAAETINAYLLERELAVKEQFNTFYKMALDKAAIVAFTDPNGKITYANEMFCQISKYSHDELIGKDHRILNSGVMDKNVFHDLWKSIKSGETWSGEICNKAKDGTLYWVDTVIVPYKNTNGVIEKFMAIRKDITDQKNQQIKLDQALQKAKQGTQAKSQFLSTMSHEIRTPLNGIIGLTQLLQETALSENQDEYVQTISKSGKILLEIINDVLDFSKIEAGKMDLELLEFDYRQFFRDLVKPHQYAASKKGIKLKLDISSCPWQVIGDDGRIGQVLNNLLSNAIKFTNSGEVEFNVTFEENANGILLRIFVIDSGIGMSEQALSKLFEAFTQAEVSTQRNFGGTGLGLSICKNLIELMGGTISAKSEIGKGSTFEVNLLLDKGKALDFQAKDEKCQEKLKQQGSFGGRILVAEDNSTNQLVISRILDLWQCKYLIVANGIEVLSALDESHFDLIFMDCHMPEMDGYQASEAIRQLPNGNKDIPIVALTANAIKGDEQTCFQAGMNDYITKPVEIKKVGQVLSKYLPLIETETKKEKPDKMDLSSSVIEKTALQTLASIQQKNAPDIIVEMIDTFLNCSKEHFEVFKSNLKEKNLSKISREAHTFKSGALTLGANKLGKLLQELEHLPNISSNLSKATSLIEKIETTCQQSIQELSSIRADRVGQDQSQNLIQGLDLKKIAYIEDDPNVQKITQYALEKVGKFDVEIYSSGKQALQQLPKFDPDLILIDAVLPEMDGVEVYEQLKLMDQFKNTPKIFLTAKTKEKDLSQLRKLDVLGVIQKPIDPSLVSEKIRGIWLKKSA